MVCVKLNVPICWIVFTVNCADTNFIYFCNVFSTFSYFLIKQINVEDGIFITLVTYLQCLLWDMKNNNTLTHVYIIK